MEAPSRTLPDELERVITQASSTTILIAAIGVEARAVLTEERHDPGLTATVLDAHVKRAALALATLSNLVGQLSMLARMGAGLVLLALGLSLTACGASTDARPSPGEFGAACGFDKPKCGAGLECFDVCTFECGHKYSTDGEYGLDVASVDRCAAVGGACERYAPGVDINVCKVPGYRVAP